MANQGLFIAFEGIDGSGESTQARLKILVCYLRNPCPFYKIKKARSSMGYDVRFSFLKQMFDSPTGYKAALLK